MPFISVVVNNDDPSLRKIVEKLMSDLDTLNTNVAANQADFATFAASVSAEISALFAAITAAQSANPGVDLTGPIAQTAALDLSIKAAIANLPTGTTPPATTPDAQTGTNAK